jgi:hypothetical protein
MICDHPLDRPAPFLGMPSTYAVAEETNKQPSGVGRLSTAGRSIQHEHTKVISRGLRLLDMPSSFAACAKTSVAR